MLRTTTNKPTQSKKSVTIPNDGDAFGRDIHRTFHYLAVYWQKLWRKDTWSRFFKGDVSLKSVCNVRCKQLRFHRRHTLLQRSRQRLGDDILHTFWRYFCTTECTDHPLRHGLAFAWLASTQKRPPQSGATQYKGLAKRY